MLLIGPPGDGKTVLFKRPQSSLPPLTLTEALSGIDAIGGKFDEDMESQTSRERVDEFQAWGACAAGEIFGV